MSEGEWSKPCPEIVSPISVRALRPSGPSGLLAARRGFLMTISKRSAWFSATGFPFTDGTWDPAFEMSTSNAGEQSVRGPEFASGLTTDFTATSGTLFSVSELPKSLYQ